MSLSGPASHLIIPFPKGAAILAPAGWTSRTLPMADVALRELAGTGLAPSVWGSADWWAAYVDLETTAGFRPRGVFLSGMCPFS